MLNGTTDTGTPRQKGKSAIHAAHAGLSKDDEAKLDVKISEMYGVDKSEAADIHADYHAERIIEMLGRWAKENGMPAEVLLKKVEGLNMQSVAAQVAAGRLTEAAAVDMLFRNIYAIESNGLSNDRYINFYG
ncbi:hypothetical protein [Nitrososphaera sp.]|uniref:hypothetical protein n=1 Tax=Nitrososphaera sp. TaxID=1971748 RepID=UPI00307F9CDB